MATLERLKEFHLRLKDEGYGGRNVFERAIGVSEGYLSQTKRKGINSDVLEKVSEEFPRLNMDWLVTGRGSMFVQEEDDEISEALENALDKLELLQNEVKRLEEENQLLRTAFSKLHVG